MSMAPLNKETPLLTSPKLPHIGPPIPEVNSVWFKLYLYHKTCYGPPSLLLIRGNNNNKHIKYIVTCFYYLINCFNRCTLVECS